MTPRETLLQLDRMRVYWERQRDMAEPGSNRMHSCCQCAVALSHAIRLVAFEHQHLTMLKETGEYRGNRKHGEFFSEVAKAAPKHEDQRTEA